MPTDIRIKMCIRDSPIEVKRLPTRLIIVRAEKLPSPRVTDRSHPFAIVQRRLKVFPQLVVIRGRKHRAIGDGIQKGRVKNALMCLAILPHHASAVDGKGDLYILQRRVVDDLIIACLLYTSRCV